MRVLAVANQKGGAGKSTLTVHLGYAAAEVGLRVLMVDLDRQRSLSLSFPPAKDAKPGLVASALFSDEPSALEPEVIDENMSIIRADPTLALLTGAVAGAEKRPAMHLRRWQDQFDLCLIDTPGIIGFSPPTTIGGLCAADAVVCPFSVGLYESASLQDLWDFLRSIKSPQYNPQLRLMGLLPSKINSKSPEELEGLAELRSMFGPVILPTIVYERAAVKQAIMRRKPVWRGARGSSHRAAAIEWRAICDFILGNLKDIKQ